MASNKNTKSRHNSLKLSLYLLNLLNRLLITLCPLQQIRIRLHIGILLRTLRQPNHSRDNRETNQDICSRQFLAAEVRAAAGSSLELLVQEAEVVVDVAVDEGGFDLGGNNAGERFDEERDGGVAEG